MKPTTMDTTINAEAAESTEASIGLSVNGSDR